jgi:hypothetical protein
LLGVAVVAWLALGANTLFDRKQLRCVERWLAESRRPTTPTTSADAPIA